MFQTDPDLLQREYYYSDDETTKEQKEVKSVNLEQVLQEVKKLEPKSGLLITENIPFSINNKLQLLLELNNYFKKLNSVITPRKRFLLPSYVSF